METADGSRLLRSEGKQTAAPVFFWIVWSVVLVTTLWYVLHYGLPIPIWDDWNNFPYLIGTRQVTLQWLWSRHNDHRIFLPRLLWLGLMQLGGGDVRSVMILNAILLALASAILALSLRAARGWTSYSDVFFPLCLMSVAHYENLLQSFGIQLVLSTALFCFILAFVIRVKERPAFIMLALLCLLLPLSGASGMVMAPPMALWFALLAFPGAGRSHAQGRPSRGMLVGSALPALLLCAAYFVDYHVPHYLSKDPATILRGCLEFMDTSLGPQAGFNFQWIYLVPLSMLFVSLVLLTSIARRNQEERARSTGLILCITSCLVLTLSVSIGRSGGGPGSVLAPRYTTLSAPILCCIYVTLSLYGSKLWGRLIPLFMLLMLLILLPANIVAARDYGQSRLIRYQSFLNDLHGGLPLEAIAERNASTLFLFKPKGVSNAIRLMMAYRIGPFKDESILLDSKFPPLQEQLLSVQPTTTNNMISKNGAWRYTGGPVNGAPGLFYALQGPRFVFGIRITYVLQDETPGRKNLEVFWAQLGRNSLSYFERNVSLATWAGERKRTKTVWVYDTIDRIQIAPYSESAAFELRSLAILVLRVE